MANYLITGIAGFIGSKVAGELQKQGNTILGIDNLSTGDKIMIPEGIECIIAGTHEKDVIGALEKLNFDAIIHIAGQSGGEMSYEDPIYDLQANTQSTLLLLDLARKIKCSKVIYASTVSVYGENGITKNLHESNITKPKSFYGVGKLASENYLRIYAEQFGINTISLRLFNTYGPGQNLKNLKQGMASIYLAQAINNSHIHVKGSKDRYRDLIFIDDVVDAFLACLSNHLNGNEVFNICTGIKTTVEDLVFQITQNLNPNQITVSYSGNTPGDVHGYTGDNSRAKEILHWSPKIRLEEGINKMVNWAIND